MSELLPKLFDRRFDDLMEIGRARLRSLAPDWTDYNLHDPGITLMELLAWTAEAQIYSLSRIRRDEREGFAALLGVSDCGSQPASGIIWPTWNDPNSPAISFAKNSVISQGNLVLLNDTDEPVFQPSAELMFIPGTIVELSTRSHGRRTADHTRSNGRGDRPFYPFGQQAGPMDRLVLEFRCNDEAGLAETSLQVLHSARWAIGVIADSTSLLTSVQAGALEKQIDSLSRLRLSLDVSIVFEDERFPIQVVSDSSCGMLQTGVLLLDLSAVPINFTALQTRQFRLEFHCPNGLPRPPRLLRIDPHALPVHQRTTIAGELHIATGQPNWSLTLEEGNRLLFNADNEPVTIDIAEPTGTHRWTRTERLQDRGPNARVFQLNVESGVVLFGNGINGFIPPADAQAMATYQVTDGLEGCVGRNRKWKVRGIQGVYGTNLQPMTGGRHRYEPNDSRKQARRNLREKRPLVTGGDIIAAAHRLAVLEVARAWIAQPRQHAPRTGTTTLVAIRHWLATDLDSSAVPLSVPFESDRWLQSVHQCLAPRLPLGMRLEVIAPHYVRFCFSALIEAQAGRDPAMLHTAISKTLRQRLSLVPTSGDQHFLQPGEPISKFDLLAWIRGVDGVGRVSELRLVHCNDKKQLEQVEVQFIPVPTSGLALWDESQSLIDVRRAAARSLR